MTVDEDLAQKIYEKELKESVAKQEQERLNWEAAMELQRQDELLQDDQPSIVKEIDWNDPAVLRYHAQQNRTYSEAEVKKNMMMNLKNQAGYKLSFFKGMTHADIRPIFEKAWD